MVMDELEEAQNYMDTKATQVLTSSAEKKSKPKPPGSTKLNEARLQYLPWIIASKGIKNRRKFTDRLNQEARKLNQEESTQPKTVATNLRKSNKLRGQVDKEAFTLKAKQNKENTIRNISEQKYKKSALREITHQMKQKFQFREIRDSDRKTISGGITHIKAIHTTQKKSTNGRKSMTMKDWKKSSTETVHTSDRPRAPHSQQRKCWTCSSSPQTACWRKMCSRVRM